MNAVNELVLPGWSCYGASRSRSRKVSEGCSTRGREKELRLAKAFVRLVKHQNIFSRGEYS